jgi:hypothetical protein
MPQRINQPLRLNARGETFIGLYVPVALKAAMVARATREGRTLSGLTRWIIATEFGWLDQPATVALQPESKSDDR